MGKHSAGANHVFWRTLFLSILKWIAIPIIPILAVIGGWNWLSDRNNAGPVPQDNPAMTAGDGDGASPSPGASPSLEKAATQILNGSGNPQFLGPARKTLEEAGYEVPITGNASRRYERTTVFYQQGHAPQAEELARVAGASVTEEAPDNLDKNIPLALVIGGDFKP